MLLIRENYGYFLDRLFHMDSADMIPAAVKTNKDPVVDSVQNALQVLTLEFAHNAKPHDAAIRAAVPGRLPLVGQRMVVLRGTDSVPLEQGQVRVMAVAVCELYAMVGKVYPLVPLRLLCQASLAAFLLLLASQLLYV